MRWFSNLRTAVKLATAFTITTILLAFIGYSGLTNLGKMDKQVVDMYETNLVPVNDLSYIQTLYQTINVDLRDMNTIARTEAENNEYKEKYWRMRKKSKLESINSASWLR